MAISFGEISRLQNECAPYIAVKSMNQSDDDVKLSFPEATERR